MKYILYRSFGNLDRDVRKHELVAVEYGASIEDVTERLIQAVTDDLEGLPEYKGCEAVAYAPEKVKEFRKVRRYAYEMMGIVYRPDADKNVLVDYGITESDSE
ncbi:carboxylate--amine ligase [uncultured Subdoligranulum sp.]|uniref:carboxylate--amine ligase n=1 Tax=uncultured Subdoligranulum sp. TaxID=512298 RepID=UPI0025D8B3DD|nr:carboxylate--amine ligase [uncultured Subdoligranulum sp.]